MVAAASKRKASMSDSSADDELNDTMIGDTAAASSSKTRSGSELVPSTKPGEAPVTKRTLQNRE